MEQALVLGFAIGFAVGSSLLWVGLLLAGMVRIPSGHVLGVTRAGQEDGSSFALVRSGSRLVMPFFQRGTLYPVALAPISRRGVTITRGGVPVLVCDLEAEVKPAKDDNGLTGYVQLFGGHAAAGIDEVVGRVVEAGARLFLARQPADEILSDPESAEKRLRDHLGTELGDLRIRLKALRLTVRPVSGAARSRDASEFSLDGFRAD
jgi:uncharacterized membrane protein YqiK